MGGGGEVDSCDLEVTDNVRTLVLVDSDSEPEVKDNVRTLVLVGRTGDGKSSTGNSILGRKAFKSKASSGSVTTASELHSTTLENGLTLNVIDTPGLFDFSEHGVIGKEITNCIKLAKDGIHAVLLVLSVRNRFSLEAEAAVKSLREIFGTKMSDYMILVYTSGDDLEEDGETLDDYLRRDCPEPLKETLLMCENRCILFENRTNDPSKKYKQVNELCGLVDKVVLKNDGKPYTNELFLETQNEKLTCDHEQLRESFEEKLKENAEMMESKLRETVRNLELKVAEEKLARLEAEAAAKDDKHRSDEEVRTLRDKVERAQRELEEVKGRLQGGCAIM